MNKLLVETDPSFLLLESNGGGYTFYNSIRHIGCRLTSVEVKILDLLYTYKDTEYILSGIADSHKAVVKNALNFIIDNGLLSTEPLEEPRKKDNVTVPSNYYFHLTYRCNLKCSYCYNKEIRRNNFTEIGLDGWKTIIDKIAPYAKFITMTGGEFMLHKDCLEIVKYIRQSIPGVYLAGISNGMHDYKREKLENLFGYFNAMSFSCDSLEREGQRKGFQPERFVSNFEWVKSRFPKLKLTIASVQTKHNMEDIKATARFCNSHECSFDKTIIIPENISDISDMPTIEQQDLMTECNENSSEIKKLNSARFRCGAGKNTCSIDPTGNVYPCQSLHYREFLMGNILNSDINDLKYVRDNSECMPSVDNVRVCSSCKVRYLCGGGCLATGYRTNGRRLDRNHLTCHLNYINSIEKLKMLNNRL